MKCKVALFAVLFLSACAPAQVSKLNTADEEQTTVDLSDVDESDTIYLEFDDALLGEDNNDQAPRTRDGGQSYPTRTTLQIKASKIASQANKQKALRDAVREQLDDKNLTDAQIDAIIAQAQQSKVEDPKEKPALKEKVDPPSSKLSLGLKMVDYDNAIHNNEQLNGVNKESPLKAACVAVTGTIKVPTSMSFVRAILYLGTDKRNGSRAFPICPSLNNGSCSFTTDAINIYRYAQDASSAEAHVVFTVKDKSASRNVDIQGEMSSVALPHINQDKFPFDRGCQGAEVSVFTSPDQKPMNVPNPYPEPAEPKPKVKAK